MRKDYFIAAPNQSYTKEFLKEIRKRDLVVYDGEAAHAIRIIPRKGMNPLFEILGEDDGCLFSISRSEQFDMYYTDGLIKQLEEAKKYWNYIKYRFG